MPGPGRKSSLAGAPSATAAPSPPRQTKWRRRRSLGTAQGRGWPLCAPSRDRLCRLAAPRRRAMAAPAVPGYSPGFKKPPAMLRLKRKRLRRSESAASASPPCGAAPRAPSVPAPSVPGRRNPFCSLENSPRAAASPQLPQRARPPPPRTAESPSAGPFWQVGPGSSLAVVGAFLFPRDEVGPEGRGEKRSGPRGQTGASALVQAASALSRGSAAAVLSPLPLKKTQSPS